MNYVTVYKKNIIEFFSFLTQIYNYTILFEDNNKLVFCSANCKIYFTIDRSQLFVDLEPVGLGISTCKSRGKYDMLTIVNSLNIGASMQYGSEIDSENEVKNEVNRLSQIMKNQCIDIIKGDKTAWTTVISKYFTNYAF